MDPIALLTFLRFPQPYDQLLQPQNLQLGHAGLSQNVKPPDPPTMGELGSVSELRSPNDWQFTAILLKQGLDIRICRNMDEFYRLIPSHSHRKWDQLESTSVQWLISGSWNGGTVPYKAIFSGDIPLHRPYVGLIYGRYLQFRFLKWPLIHLCVLLGFRSHVFDHRHRGEPRATDDGATGLDANGDEDLFGTKGDQPLWSGWALGHNLDITLREINSSTLPAIGVGRLL